MYKIVVAAVLLAPALSSAQPAAAPAKPYADAIKVIDEYVTRQVAGKRLPGLAYAIVDGNEIVAAGGFGNAMLDKSKPVTPNTVFRIGSVSKLFTDIAVMQLVEKGEIDLDAPVTKYLPNFKPVNPFGKPITLRMMMAHRSGLVREPPVGNYFDDSAPTLAKTIDSLNGTTLVYEPGTRQKYSNAAIAAVGYALEKTQKQPFDKIVRERVLEPLGIKKTSFGRTPALQAEMAQGLMWTYHGREFPAPTFELGIAPAGCMYSTVTDLGKFLSVVFAGGRGPNGPILKPETLKQMLAPQFAKEGAKRGFGIGFQIGELDGKTRIGHNGAMYGFATDLAFLPDEKLGVVVVASRDFANPCVTHLADMMLRAASAAKQGKPLPQLESPTPLESSEAKSLAGRYQSSDKIIDLIESAGRLWVLAAAGGVRVEVRKLGQDLVTDDALGMGRKIRRDGENIRVGKDEYKRIADEKPAPCPEHFRGLIGEYGWDHDILYIFEKDGKLHANIEWFSINPLKEIDKDTYAFPDDGSLYAGEKLLFTRDKNGKATQVVAASVVFKRRPLDGEDGRTFRIRPLLSMEELKKAAAKASPPPEKGEFGTTDLVELIECDPTIKLDLRYATDNNFMGAPLYPPTAKAYMQKPAAEAVARANKKLAEMGYGLLIHDSYRPWYVTKMFYDATPDKFHNFVADPSLGSRHNRGCAVDLTLYDLKTGKPIEMVGGYDEFSDRSFPDYLGGTSQQRWHRNVLKKAMESEGFTVYENEWWHFDFNGWRKYAIGNKTFEELEKK